MLPPPTALPPLVDVVLPCLDEAAALGWLLGRMPARYRPIVVDNGSSDGSGALAASLGATVIQASPRGFGAACARGLAIATAPVVAFMDADGSLDPRELPAVAGPVLSGAAELVLGARRPTSRSAWPWHLQLANRVLCRQVHRRTGLLLHDLGPMRAASRAALLDLRLADRRSGFPLEMVTAAADAGWRVEEVEVAYRPRVGRSKVTGTPLGAARAVLDMSRVLRA